MKVSSEPQLGETARPARVLKNRKGPIMIGLVFLLALPLYFLSSQYRRPLRFEIGSMDYDYLDEKEQFYSRRRLEGPIRYPDNTVEVIEFYGRLTKRRATFKLPYHAFRSPVRIRIRCHRFGLDGTVALIVNGEHLEDFVFTERSYPWGGIQAIIPQEVAERGALTVELETRDFELSSSHIPEDFGVGVDWIELEPFSRGVLLWPLPQHWLMAFAFPLLGFMFTRNSGVSLRSSLSALCIVVITINLLNAFFPLQTQMAISRLWIVFPLGFALRCVLAFAFGRRLLPRLAPGEITFLGWLFVASSLGHSFLIFFPNHAPPDIWNHLPQVEWLGTLDLSTETLLRYSTSSDVFDDGHVRPRFGVAYGAPYPPFLYALTFAVSKIHGDVRFLMEFIPVLVGSLMLVMVYLIAKVVWGEVVIARLAAILLALEISLWHHVHRVHGPGIVGEFFVLCFLLFLVAYRDSLQTKKGVLWFAGLSTVTLLSYPAPVVQLSIFVLWLALLVGWAGEERSLLKGLAVGFSLGAAVAVAIYYAPYAIDAFAKADVILDRGDYDPPATFLFLNNQMRDTVRILSNGYPLYVALSLVGLFSLGRWKAVGFGRRVLIAAVLAYVTMLVLKDPIFLPRVFLHAKEDLFYSPVACLLAALPLASLWASRTLRGVAVAILLLLFFLAVRCQALNINTLSDQTIRHIS